MQLKQILALACVVFLAVAALESQVIGEDEIRIVSEQYVPQTPGTIHVESTIVDLNVVVRDSHGQPVPGLQKDDFEVFDQGKRQAISLFSVETANPPPVVVAEAVKPGVAPTPPTPAPAPKPRYIALYFDDENMSSADLTFGRQAAEGFVKKNLEPSDLAGVFTSSTTVTQNFTSDTAKLLDALGQLKTHQRRAGFGAMSCPKIEPYQAQEIVDNYNEHTPAFDLAFAQAVECNCPKPPDALCLQEQARLVQNQAAVTLTLGENFARDSLGVVNDVIRYLGKMPGRRMIVMVSSGFYSRTNNVLHVQDKVIDAALHAGVVINSLDAKGLAADWVGGNPADGPPIVMTGGNGAALMAYADEVASDERAVSDDPLALLAQGTGGKFFHNSNDLGGGIREIAAIPEVSYAMAFAPDSVKDDGGYHSVKVRLRGKSGFTISARPGYFAPSKEKKAPAARLEQLNKEVLAGDELSGIPVQVTTQAGRLGSGEPAIRVALHVDVHGLSFKKVNGRHNGRLLIVTSLFDNQNHFLSGAETVVDMNLKDTSLVELQQKGVDAHLSLQAPPGTYRLREVVQEEVGGRISASSRAVEIQ